jgi:hypothetical protein
VGVVCGSAGDVVQDFFSLPVFHGSFSIGGGVWRFVPVVAAVDAAGALGLFHMLVS